MKRATLALSPFVLLLVPFLSAQTPETQSGASLWDTLVAPAANPAKAAVVENVDIVRDRIHITLVSGTIQFALPANEVTFAAVFHGQGRVQVVPPNAIEAQQLNLFTKQGKIEAWFTDATFSFTDGLTEDVQKMVNWRASAAGSMDLYVSRQKEREDLGQSVLPRMLQGVMSADGKRSAFFLADLKLSGKEWVQFSYDAREPEEISIGRWVDLGMVKRFDTWMSFPAGGHTAAEAWQNPQAKEDFAVRSYNIDANLSSGADLAAVTRVVIAPQRDGQRVLIFDLDSNLRVDSIKDAHGKAMPFYQARERKDRYQSYGDYVALLLEQPLQVGADLTLEFRYGGKRAIRKAGSGNYFCESSGWYPERPNSFSTRSNFELTFHSPKGYALVATGTKTSETVDGPTRITSWKSEMPLAVAGFAYGDYKVYRDKAGSVAVEVYANREPDEVMAGIQRHFDSGGTPGMLGSGVAGAVGNLTPSAMAKTMGIEMANTLRVFADYFGSYPYQQLCVTSLPISYSYGQGWPGLVYLWSASFLDATQRHEMGLPDGVELTDFFRAHESSHQWWGHKVGWKSYHDQWLSEGFAEFSGNLYVQYRENMKEYVNRWRKEKETLRIRDTKGHLIESLGPIWMGQRISSSETDRGSYQDLIYSKGGYVVHMLRMQLWDSRSPDPDHYFKEMMRDYCDTFENRAASTEDFKAIVEKHMLRNMDLDGNHKMDWFFNEYVYGTGIPQYAFHASLRATPDGKMSISGELTRAGVPDNWKDVVPIYAHIGDKSMRLGSIAATHPSEKINVVIAQKVDKITINDFEDNLADVKQ